jgi:predicted dehydrogenase
MPLRILQVGMGGFGRSWAEKVIPRVPEAELVGCADLDPVSLEKARAVTTLPEDRYFLSLDKALESTDADALLVTATIPAHIPLIMAGLAAGKHVLVEKPFAPTVDEACRAIEDAAERGLVLMVSQNYRFFPAVRAAQKLVASGELGELSSVQVDFRKYDNHAARGERLHYVMPQPMLVDMAVHHFDLMRAVLGREPREIQAVSWNPPSSKYVDPPSAFATIKFEGGVEVSYRGSWLSPGLDTPWAGEWRMDFAEAELNWTSRKGGENDISADRVCIRRLDGTIKDVRLPRIRYLDRAGGLQVFIDAIRTGQEPETSGRNNLPTLSLTLAAVESAASGSAVSLGGDGSL